MTTTTLEIPALHIQLRAYLDTLTINQNTIGSIRARLLLPFSCDWNGLVRDETAAREQCVPDDAPSELLGRAGGGGRGVGENATTKEATDNHVIPEN